MNVPFSCLSVRRFSLRRIGERAVAVFIVLVLLVMVGGKYVIVPAVVPHELPGVLCRPY